MARKTLMSIFIVAVGTSVVIYLRIWGMVDYGHSQSLPLSGMEPRDAGQPLNVPVEIMEKVLNLNEEKVNQDDPRLISIIKEYFIKPPSTEPYNLSNPKRVDFAGQGKTFFLAKKMTDAPAKGFFIECGALDGERLSTTLYFEREKQWSGLLVEANVKNFRELSYKHRKAYSINVCLSTTEYPIVVSFNQKKALGRIINDSLTNANRLRNQLDIVRLQCFPLYSILLAIGQLHIDYFGLDVEGSEVDILRTVPLDIVDITYIMAEHSHVKGGKAVVEHFFKSNGYKVLEEPRENLFVKKQR